MQLDAVLGGIEHFASRTRMYGKQRAEISTTQCADCINL